MDMAKTMHQGSILGVSYSLEKMLAAGTLARACAVHDTLWRPMCHHDVDIPNSKVMPEIPIILKAPIATLRGVWASINIQYSTIL